MKLKRVLHLFIAAILLSLGLGQATPTQAAADYSISITRLESNNPTTCLTTNCSDAPNQFEYYPDIANRAAGSYVTTEVWGDIEAPFSLQGQTPTFVATGSDPITGSPYCAVTDLNSFYCQLRITIDSNVKITVKGFMYAPSACTTDADVSDTWNVNAAARIEKADDPTKFGEDEETMHVSCYLDAGDWTISRDTSGVPYHSTPSPAHVGIGGTKSLGTFRYDVPAGFTGVQTMTSLIESNSWWLFNSCAFAPDGGYYNSSGVEQNNLYAPTCGTISSGNASTTFYFDPDEAVVLQGVSGIYDGNTPYFHLGPPGCTISGTSHGYVVNGNFATITLYRPLDNAIGVKTTYADNFECDFS
jgi:hypothetical protein